MAVTQMQNRLAGGDKSAVGALAQLGLNLEDLAMKLDPERSSKRLPAAIAKIPIRPRTHVAMELLGKTGAATLPLLCESERTRDQADRFGGVMSDDVVAGGDELGDALSKLTTYGRA
jgi:hypothetical protein